MSLLLLGGVCAAGVRADARPSRAPQFDGSRGDDPAGTAEWYEKHLGITVRNKSRNERVFRSIPTGPSAATSHTPSSMILAESSRP